MKFILKILLLITILGLMSCGTDAMEEISISGSWDLVGFEGENIQFVRSEGHAFYLATDTEIYRSEDLSDWSAQNMGQILKEGEKVRDFLVFSEMEILGVVLWKDEISSEERENSTGTILYPCFGQRMAERIGSRFIMNSQKTRHMSTVFQLIRNCRIHMQCMVVM